MWKYVGFGSGSLGMCFRAVFCCPGTPQGLFRNQKKQHLGNFDIVSFQKNSVRKKNEKKHVTELERYLTKVVCMDHTDHVGFQRNLTFHMYASINTSFR